MWITVKDQKATEIDDAVVERVLDVYPEEQLLTRPVFQAAFSDGAIRFKDLKEECDKILIPWQLFLLSRRNLEQQLAHIEEQRFNKVSPRLVAKRRGSGDVTSKRIIDRLIRQQEYVIHSTSPSENPFCRSLRGVETRRAAERIVDHFSISRSRLWSRPGKAKALEYLIEQVEARDINVSQGVLVHKLLPMHQVVPSDVYRNTSGFAIKDERVPFVFLPSDVNPDEVESRQIYTLIYLLAVIGLDQYGHYLDKNFKARMLNAKGIERRIHAITTEVLMPTSEIEPLRGETITETMRDTLSDKLKVSPTALVVTLRMRGIIGASEYEELKPAEYVPKGQSKTQKRTPRITTSVRKFCGLKSYEAINRGLRRRTLPSTQAQYLIFGAINKKGFMKYRKELSI